MAVKMVLLISVLIACLQLCILHCEAIEDWNRFDCFPEKENPSEAECKARKCLWMAKPSGAKKVCRARFMLLFSVCLSSCPLYMGIVLPSYFILLPVAYCFIEC